MDKLIAWYKAEYKRRTDLLDRDQGQIDWLDPGTRVSFSEVWAKAEELGVNESPVTLRIIFSKL